VGFYVRKLVVGVFFYDPFEFWEYLVWLNALDRRWLEFFTKGNELHVLLTVLVNLAEEDL
jgi:hypothetical protein